MAKSPVDSILIQTTNHQASAFENASLRARWIDRITPSKLFLILLVASFLLRILYSGYLFEDDGLWFVAAEEMLRGKALYREVYFDKPPLLPLTYALLFKLFGTHILVIRLFSIFYAAALSSVLFWFGSRFYDKRIGVISALLFTLFSTTSGSGHVNGLNTDFLMALPYTLAVCLSVGISSGRVRRQPAAAFAAGVLAAVAVQVNPKGWFALLLFALIVLLPPSLFNAAREREGARENASAESRGWIVSRLSLIGLAGLGFIAGSAPVISYLAATRSLGDYWRDVWLWGTRYAGYHSTAHVLQAAARHSVGYFGLNSVLLIGLGVLTTTTLIRLKERRDRATGSRDSNAQPLVPETNARSGLFTSTASDHQSDDALGFDCSLLIWFGVSFLGLALGGRFYGHYFFQVSPCLSVIGARGLMELARVLKTSNALLRRTAFAVVAIGIAITLVRFHTRTVVLAVDLVRGKKSESTARWYHEMLNGEERRAAAMVRGLDQEAAERMGTDSIRESGPRTRPPSGSSDYLFVWGYRPEVYYWSGLLPVSRYLSVQPLTGVPADVHYVNGERGSLLDEAQTASARAELVRDLEAVRPWYIIDEIGMFNSALNINSFPETAEFMKAYKSIGAAGRLMIYRRRDLKKELRRE